MRLLIIGSLQGQIGAASKIAMSRGARVSQVADIEKALQTLREGGGADLVMIDAALDVAKLMASLEGERISVPVVAVVRYECLARFPSVFGMTPDLVIEISRPDDQAAGLSRLLAAVGGNTT